MIFISTLLLSVLMTIDLIPILSLDYGAGERSRRAWAPERARLAPSSLPRGATAIGALGPILFWMEAALPFQPYLCKAFPR